MDSQAVLKNGSDRSDDEKPTVGTVHDDYNPHTSDLPADPDAHLSAEERAKIVSSPPLYN